MFKNSIIDIRCGNSLTDNGNASCTSGKVGVGYAGDTCSFTCNTGYELIGSDTRTCQSDGSWSGSDNLCIRGELYLWYKSATSSMPHVRNMHVTCM